MHGGTTGAATESPTGGACAMSSAEAPLDTAAPPTGENPRSASVPSAEEGATAEATSRDSNADSSGQAGHGAERRQSTASRRASPMGARRTPRRY